MTHMSTDTPVPASAKSKVAETEEKILGFWDANQIFKKTLEKESPKGDFVFYDGPPFATGLPHYGHVIPSTVKDVIPRYKTMQGYRVRRRWGWDCHGLPVENLIEKELGLASKKDILDYGIGKFNEQARGSVMRYADDWRKIIPRLGRWVDMDDDYRTMDASYTESVWWAFSQLHKKGLVYEGFKSMSLCPRCETTLSNFEVSQGYKDITDISVYVKFELKEEKGTYFIAWTTTPWTLPGNVALAINTHLEYQKVQVGDARYIIAVGRLEAFKALVKEEVKLLETYHGKDLVGKEYIPVFDYYASDKKLKNRENGWRVYGADFVTTDSGTGIVHIAPAFGADDYELSLVENLPFVQHVATDGTFKAEVKDFAGQHVKPKEDHQKGDVEIIKYLAHTGKLFAKEKIIHSYPHCWRCDTPLLNYASSSWFVKVTQFKDKLVKENKKVTWVPPEIGEGRFGNWLEGARDWAISRSRFWGAPLPVWKDEKTGEEIVMGSVDDLKKYSHAKNTYYIVRHGEALNNTKSVISSKKDNPHPLTPAGRKQAEEAANWLKDKKIDLVIASPFIRTQETAKIISGKLGSKVEILTDDRVAEINLGVHDGEDFKTFAKTFEHKNRFKIAIEGGENYADVKRRMGAFLYSLEEKYSGKNILIVSHDSPLFLLEAAAGALSEKDCIARRGTDDHYMKNGLPQKLEFHPLPHNENFELELHRPFIDDLKLVKENGNKLVRVPEVFDCWFESGSMPFGEAHYPFSKEEFNPKPGPFSKILGKTRGYPADFIAEGLDQTRGWFYSMIVLGVALFGRSPYKHVVVNGLLLAEDGQKMSKSKKNYPELMPTIEKYGADALRYYLMASPVVHAQDFCFSEKGVDEVVKKHIGRLNNVVSFYEMYVGGLKNEKTVSKNILDLWILARLAEVGTEVTKNLEVYELDKATRPFADFIDDLSTWYLRRSRDRFKGDDESDKQAALATTRDVLLGLSKLLAPIMPFLAEDIYRRVKGEKESVHLEDWPEFKKPDAALVKDMQEARKIASLGLEARMKAKVNVRQPLAKLTVNTVLKADFLDLIEDEVNVKEVALDKEAAEGVVLDTVLTPALVEEGQVRELVRMIQDLRKESGLTIHDKATLTIEATAETRALVEKNKHELSRITSLKDIIVKEGTETKLSLEK